ncbi:MAG: AAA family ATPase [Clostridia bacterium]|nr:AAA family ATPase [Clostridia bacterium]
MPGRYDTFPDYLDTVYKKTGVPFVFILDEWDAPVRGTKFGVEEQKEYLGHLTALFKGNAYAALVYMTGVLPIVKHGSHSELNMFTEISMVNAHGLRDYTGFTKEDVMRLCEERGKPFEKVRSRCAGYTVDGIVLYSPGSVVCVVRSLGEGTDGFGTSDDMFEVLEPYIGVNARYVRDVLSYLVAGKSVKVNVSGFSGNAGPFMFDDNFLTLLIHLGYLTYNRNTKRARASDREMKGRLKGLINKIAG